jgi:hypothetical protein
MSPAHNSTWSGATSNSGVSADVANAASNGRATRSLSNSAKSRLSSQTYRQGTQFRYLICFRTTVGTDCLPSPCQTTLLPEVASAEIGVGGASGL